MTTLPASQHRLVELLRLGAVLGRNGKSKIWLYLYSQRVTCLAILICCSVFWGFGSQLSMASPFDQEWCRLQFGCGNNFRYVCRWIYDLPCSGEFLWETDEMSIKFTLWNSSYTNFLIVNAKRRGHVSDNEHSAFLECNKLCMKKQKLYQIKNKKNWIYTHQAYSCSLKCN